ncbi:feruloyl esterase-like protein B precursor [Annulohypoxylon maeteangense]|uniref:feruloyl esterase-like protein B precursor n=1 Tax=Annulohypoxylon maeteangense TaxID=1927788 RepID=UPI00200725C4|nr:feruloyl esterase-like protein B precursor [Annulohypoxylon maeteangense]KAI0880917.1 feruloyl esterase-like protein B precursor [Annulohypoxylon maeteangense]
MVSTRVALLLGAAIVTVGTASLADYCTVDYATSVLPIQDLGLGITIDTSSVSASLTTNRSVSSEWYAASVIDYCDVTFAYSHNGLNNDTVHVSYLVPTPESFSNRYVSTGGGGLAINSGAFYSPTGIIVGAVSGITDGGFGNFNTQYNAAFLLAEGTVNWQATYMFGYQAHHELAMLGKQFTRNFFNVSDSDKVYSYYQGCSEGGREGWSQIQRFVDQFDGLVTGAPAFRFSQLQTNHLSGGVIEGALGYYPPPCELEKIVNLTIAACDGLDGKVDGVVARSDLCKLHFDYKSTIGEPYYCAASSRGGGPGGLHRRQFPGSGPTPEQNGTITAEGVAVASAFTNGLIDSSGKRIYLNPQPGSTFADAITKYNTDTSSWEPSIPGLGGEWIARYLNLEDKSNIDSLTNVTADTLRDWMALGMQKYEDSLQTTWPDISAFKEAGGKVILVHGEADSSIPAASSVHYYESVRNAMYGDLAYDESVIAMDEFYRLYIVPGGAHCGSNPNQRAGGWPATTLQTVIEWAEEGVEPDMLANEGEIEALCKWPLRPLWSGDGENFDCVSDEASRESWIYTFDAFKVPVY